MDANPEPIITWKNAVGDSQLATRTRTYRRLGSRDKLWFAVRLREFNLWLNHPLEIMTNKDSRHAKLLQDIKEAVGENNFEAWMRKPIPSLHGRIPLEVMEEPGGLDALERLIIAINYGVPL